MPPIEIARRGIKIRDAHEEIGGPGEDDPFDMGQQRSSEAVPLPGRSNRQQFEIIPEQEMPAQQRETRHVLVHFDDIAVPARRKGGEKTFPMMRGVSQAFPGIRIGEHTNDSGTIVRMVGPHGRLSGHDRSPPASGQEVRDGQRFIPSLHDLVLVEILDHLTGMDAFPVGMHHNDAPISQS